MEDIIRWNRSLSKAFDVDVEYLAPSQLEYDWVSKFLDVAVKDVYQTETSIGGAKMGAWLSACKAIFQQYKLVSVRNILFNGTEAPPVYEVIQLNSKLRDDFLVEGISFYKDEHSFVVKFSPRWWGIQITAYAKASEREFLRNLIGLIYDKSKEYSFLKGEAFSLSGEFITRTELSWNDVFLTEKNSKAITYALKALNEKGKDAAARGMIFMGGPGNGKTLSGKVIMNETKATFVWLSARDMARFGGFSAITEAFDLAKELAPCILFFEDIDAWLHTGTTDLLKTEMDGVETRKGLMTILTTNFPEQLPEALIDRPGRFHDVLRFDPPDHDTRAKMLKVWLPLINVDTIEHALSETNGMSGAHIFELCNFAKTIKEQEQLDWNAAVSEAIRKVKEQRQLIDETRNPKKKTFEGVTKMQTYKFKSQFNPNKPGEPIRMNFTTPSEAKEFDDTQMTVVHFVSTETQDRGGDVVRAEGINDANYKSNPVVLYGHDHNAFPIGKSLWRKVMVRNGVKGYLAKTQFAPTDEGKKAYELWKGDFLNAASIGFIPVEYEPITDSQRKVIGHDFKKSELLEYSIVPVPMNAEAVKMAIQKSIGKSFSTKAAERMLKATELFVNRQLKPETFIKRIRIGLVSPDMARKDEVKTEKEYLADILMKVEEILDACDKINKADDEHIKAIKAAVKEIVNHCDAMKGAEEITEDMEIVVEPKTKQYLEDILGQMKTTIDEFKKITETKTKQLENSVAVDDLVSEAVNREFRRLTGIISD